MRHASEMTADAMATFFHLDPSWMELATDNIALMHRNVNMTASNLMNEQIVLN
jgi:hypothetical protein